MFRTLKISNYIIIIFIGASSVTDTELEQTRDDYVMLYNFVMKLFWKRRDGVETEAQGC